MVRLEQLPFRRPVLPGQPGLSAPAHLLPRHRRVELGAALGRFPLDGAPGSVGRSGPHVLSQWPGMTLGMAREALGEGFGGKSAHRSCRFLSGHGLIDRIRHHKEYRYMTTPKVIDCLSRRDRVHFSQSKSRVDSLSWIARPSLRAHEDGVFSFVGRCLAAGLPVAAGWRCWEHLGRSGGISPDGQVFLERSPYGPTWAYFEYEPSARGEARVRRKLGGYGSGTRGDGWPVLFVCWSDVVEDIFHRVGRELQIPMLTATIGRLEEHGPLGNSGCWSLYGQPAFIG